MVSFRMNNVGLGAVFGGVFLATEVGLGKLVLVVDRDEFEFVSSSLVNVP